MRARILGQPIVVDLKVGDKIIYDWIPGVNTIVKMQEGVVEGILEEEKLVKISSVWYGTDQINIVGILVEKDQAKRITE